MLRTLVRPALGRGSIRCSRQCDWRVSARRSSALSELADLREEAKADAVPVGASSSVSVRMSAYACEPVESSLVRCVCASGEFVRPVRGGAAERGHVIFRHAALTRYRLGRTLFPRRRRLVVCHARHRNMCPCESLARGGLQNTRQSVRSGREISSEKPTAHSVENTPHGDWQRCGCTQELVSARDSSQFFDTTAAARATSTGECNDCLCIDNL